MAKPKKHPFVGLSSDQDKCSSCGKWKSDPVHIKSVAITGPTYFEDNEPCGYCNRPIGNPHENWCRQ